MEALRAAEVVARKMAELEQAVAAVKRAQDREGCRDCTEILGGPTFANNPQDRYQAGR